MGAFRRGGWVATTICLAGACTAGNNLDVCSRAQTKEHDLNSRGEGNQSFYGHDALAAMPGGGVMAVWTSADETGQQSEVRGGITSRDGALLPTCDALGEFTFSPPDELADQPVVAAPPTNGGVGLIAYRVLNRNPMEIKVVPIGQSGCSPINHAEPQPFVLSQTPINGVVANPSVAYLGDQTFVVTWTETPGSGTKGHLVARRFKLPQFGKGPQFLPTPNAPDGSAGDAVAPGAYHVNGTLLSLPDGAALAYFNLSYGTARIELVRFAPDLSIRWGPIALRDSPPATGFIPDDPGINLAWAPDSFLVAWLTGNLQLQPVIEGIFVSSDGKFLSAPRAPNGGPFRFGIDNGVTEGSVAVLGLDDNGFLATWQETGTADHADNSGSGIRAISFNADGSVRFANRACEETDFQLNLSTAGSQTGPALVRSGDGTLMAAWTTKGGDGSDRSGSGLEIVDLQPKELFPLR